MMIVDVWTAIFPSGSWAKIATPISTLTTEEQIGIATETGIDLLADGVGVFWFLETVDQPAWNLI